MSLRDKQFYSSLFALLLLLAVLLRLLVMFVGIRIQIPYLDAFLQTSMMIIGTIIKSFAGFLGGWSE